MVTKAGRALPAALDCAGPLATRRSAWDVLGIGETAVTRRRPIDVWEVCVQGAHGF